MLHFSMLHAGSHVAGIWDLRMPCLDSFLEPRHIDMSRLLSSLVCRHLQLHHGTLTTPSFRAPRAPTAVLLRKFLCEQPMVRNVQWPAVWAKSLLIHSCTIMHVNSRNLLLVNYTSKLMAVRCCSHPTIISVDIQRIHVLVMYWWGILGKVPQNRLTQLEPQKKSACSQGLNGESKSEEIRKE